MIDLTYYNRGTIALNKGKVDKAIDFFKKQKFTFKELHLNLANAYRLKGMNKLAWEQYRLANSVDVLDLDNRGGEYANALSNMGLLAYCEGDDSLASEYYTRALALDPLHYMSIWNFSLAKLREWCSGSELHKWAWKMHEYRFKAVKAVDTSIPRWDGSKVDKLLIVNEQGMGDKLMYGRYLHKCASLCSELWVQCPSEMDTFFSDYKVCREASESGCTASIPFGCLPEMFGMIDGTWLAGKYYPVKREKPYIVVEWAGNPGHLNDRNRSCFAGYFSALAKKFPMYDFVNVRPNSPSVRGVRKLKTSNWSDSAEIVAGAALVISVDTSLVHLAGSLGVECWELQPLSDTDFRWGNPTTKILNGMDIESNIWYKSVKVLDNPGWEELFAYVERKLKAWEMDKNEKNN